MDAPGRTARASPPAPFRRGVGASYARTAILLGALAAIVVLAADALGGAGAIVELLSTRPPIAERARRLRAMRARS